MRIPSAGRFGGWASTRYGGFSGGGPDALSRFLEMTPDQLRVLDCMEYLEAIPVITAGVSQFSADQRRALKARADECATNNPLLPDFLDPGVEGNVIDDLGGGLTDAVSSALEGAGVVLGNVLISAAGAGLIVLGIFRLFGTSPARVARAGARLTPQGRAAGL